MKTKVFLILVIGFFFISFANDSIATSISEVPNRTLSILSEEAKGSYNWITNMQLENGLVESAEHTNFVSLYDNSLTALVFLSHGDIDKAEKIFDFFNNRIDSELLNNEGGFFQFRDAKGNNGSSTWLGDNAWLLLAINNYREITGSTKYDRLASELEIWIRSLQDTDGGLWGGLRENGNRIPKITEGIITAFNAVPGYDSFHEGILSFLKKERFDTKEQVFVAQPDYPKYNFALDLYSLGFLIMEDLSEDVLNNANKFLNTQNSTITGEVIEGYCFDEDKDVVWLEGTAQMALAFQSGGFTKESERIMNTLRKTFVPSELTENVKAIPYTANQGTNFESSVLWNHSDKAPAISSNVWYLFVETGFNPFQLEKNKGIPAEDKFWTNSVVN